MTFEIRLRERGPPTVITLSEWLDRNLELPLRTLAIAGVVKLTRTSAGVMVTPSNHVGEMRVPGARLTVEAKSPELLSAMELVVTLPRARAAKHFDPKWLADRGSDSDPAGAFVRALLGAITDGLPWSYGAVTESTSFPRGRLNAGETIRQLLSRGVRHRVVVTKPVRLQEARLVRVVRAAHACLASSAGCTPALLAEVETLLAAFDVNITNGTTAEGLAEAVALLMTPPPNYGNSTIELIRRCHDLLSQDHLLGYQVIPIPNGIARFRNLEELWERCVERLADDLATGSTPDLDTRLHALRSSPPRLFIDGGPTLDPDIVVFCGETITGIFDAKYKPLESGNEADAGDVYQITAYVRRTASRIGMLVHFADAGAGATRIGATPEGADVVIATITSDILRLQGEHALTHVLGLHPALLKSCQDRLGYCSRHERGDGVPNLSRDVLLRA